MAATLPLHDMTLADKLEIMEALWDDLSRDPSTLPSPAWHNDVLQAREQRIEAGEGHFIDWEVAKAELRRRVA